MYDALYSCLFRPVETHKLFLYMKKYLVTRVALPSKTPSAKNKCKYHYWPLEAAGPPSGLKGAFTNRSVHGKCTLNTDIAAPEKKTFHIL
jgi:hypothetical protein